MKASELIKELEIAIADGGDLNVAVVYDNQLPQPTKVSVCRNIKYSSTNTEDVIVIE
jgi:hypothetical protein